MRRLLPLLTLLALAAGCSQRDRANPLDPANPGTGGRPGNFAAIAGYALVTLSWTPEPNLAIDGFRLLRLADGDSAWRPLAALIDPAAGLYVDTSVRNGATYRYQLSYVISGHSAHAPAEDIATPGPVQAWVADAGAGELVELSADGRRVAARFGDAGRIQSVAVDREGGEVWTSSTVDGLVTLRVPGEIRPLQFTGFSAPLSIATSAADHSAWVCELQGSLAHVATDGSRVAPGTIGLLERPTGVAVCAADQSVWAVENQGDRVRHWTSTGAPLGVTTVPAPWRVTVDSLTRVAWVTSADVGRLWRIAPDGRLIDSTSVASGPVGVAIDHLRGRAWVADAVGNRVLALDPSTLAVLFTVGGIAQPRDVDVDPLTGDAWVAASGQGAVVRLDANGHVLAVAGGLGAPMEVRLTISGP